MEAISAAASVTALIEVGAKLAKYLADVKGAQQQIQDLNQTIRHLTTTLDSFEQLLDRPDADLLKKTSELGSELEKSQSKLDSLTEKLEENKSGSFGRKLLRSLTFPIKLKADVDNAIKILSDMRITLSTALSYDMTEIHLDEKLFECLPAAKGAYYDCHHTDHRRNTTCHPNTRVDILKNISNWADDPQASPVYWLYGPAGTGKSTICRSAAQSFRDRDKKILGASFFFKKGEEECGKSSLLFPTLATQLVQFVPNFKSKLRKYLQEDRHIATKRPQEMFDKLLIRPLSDLTPTEPVQTYVVAIDALDESDGDMATIVDLVSRAKEVTPISLRFLVTSREEPPIRTAFRKVGAAAAFPFALHHVSRKDSEHDIRLFLNDELEAIATRHNMDPQRPWPGQQELDTLVTKSCTPEPLFIYAATVLRFLDDKTETYSPDSQLQTWLGCSDAQLSQLASLYQPILRSLLAPHPPATSRKLCKEIREIVASISVLLDPLPAKSLGSLLRMSDDTVNRRVGSLRAVLEVPDDPNYPVRLLHKSFSDYILSPGEQGDDDFCVAQSIAHEDVAKRCIALMRAHLRRDMCDVKHPGVPRTSIKEKIDQYFEPALKYACRFWAQHVEQGNYMNNHSADVFEFLTSHFLHWLEALGLLGTISDSLPAIRGLRRSLEQQRDQPDTAQDLSTFLYDAERFVLCYHSVIDSSPLQLYASALVFAPEQSVVRKTFERYIPGWISPLPSVDSNWNAVLQTLEGHTHWVTSIIFSHDSTLLASASNDKTIKLWDAASGKNIQTLEGHTDWVRSIVFSHDSTLLASASHDKTIKLWDAAIGNEIRSFKTDRVPSYLSFAPDISFLFSDLDCFSIGPKTSGIPIPGEKTDNGNHKGQADKDKNMMSMIPYLGGGGTWVAINTLAKSNVLWLPPDHRPGEWAASVSPSGSSMAAIGTRSGRVVILGFRQNVIPFG